MSISLVPRLTALGVSTVLGAAGSKPLTPHFAKAVLDDRASMLSFAASGGSREDKLVWALGETVRNIAVQSGFPDNSSRVSRSKFDRETTMFLAAQLELRTGEFLRDDVWAYITTVVAPDIVEWRFPGRPLQRYGGGARNALQRLWWRGVVLDQGERHENRWQFVRALTEDAFVQIFERTSIAANGTLAIALAEAWLRTTERIGRGNMESVMRRATKLVRIRNEVIDLAGVTPDVLSTVVESCFDEAVNSQAVPV